MRIFGAPNFVGNEHRQAFGAQRVFYRVGYRRFIFHHQDSRHGGRCCRLPLAAPLNRSALRAQPRLGWPTRPFTMLAEEIFSMRSHSLLTFATVPLMLMALVACSSGRTVSFTYTKPNVTQQMLLDDEKQNYRTGI